MTVAVKYCGGCNPRYDRPALARRMKEDFPLLTVTGPDAKEPDFVLVLCGCPSRCAEHRDIRGRLGKLVVYSDDQYPALSEAVSWLTDNAAVSRS